VALTAAQRAEVRRYAGWGARFRQFDSALDNAMDALGSDPEHEVQITNALTATPPGLLAQLADVDAKLTGAYGRLKADKVGSIELNRGELFQLRSEGRRLTGRLCALLGVQRRADVYGSGGTGDNYVGK